MSLTFDTWNRLTFFIYICYLSALVVFALQLISILVLFRPRPYEYAAWSRVSRCGRPLFWCSFFWGKKNCKKRFQESFQSPSPTFLPLPLSRCWRRRFLGFAVFAQGRFAAPPGGHARFAAGEHVPLLLLQVVVCCSVIYRLDPRNASPGNKRNHVRGVSFMWTFLMKTKHTNKKTCDF